MADPQENAPAPGEIKIDLAALRSDSDLEAAGALAGLFAPEDSPDDASQSAETGDQETGPTGDTEDGHSEQGEIPAIEPPVSWSADAKELFAKLPPELQQTVAERESDRERLLATHGQKASELAKQVEADRAAIANERAQQVQFFNALALQLTPEIQRFQGINWQELAATKPAEWAVQSQAYQDTINRYNAAMQAAGQLQQQQQAEQLQKDKQAVQTEHTKLVEKWPELSDPLKGRAALEDVFKQFPEVTRDEWGTVRDHRHLLIARDAARWRAQEAAKAGAQAKRTPGPQSNVRTLRPAARPPGSAADEATKKEFAALHGKLAKSGSDRDAAALLEKIL